MVIEQPRSSSGLPVAASLALVVAGLVRAGVLIYLGRLFYDVAVEIATPSGSAADSGLDDIARSFWLFVPLLLTSVAATVLYLVWVFGAHARAERMPGPAPRWARGWTIASWFIPLAGAVLAPTVLADIWRASAPPHRRPVLVRIWGATLLLGWAMFAGVFIANQMPQLRLVEAARATALLWTFDGLVELVGAFALASAVLWVARYQSDAGL